MRIRAKQFLSVIIVCIMMMSGMSITSSAIDVDTDMLIYGSKIAEKEDYNIVPGVTESYIVTQNDDGSNQVRSYVLEVDLGNPDIGIITSYKNYMNNLSDTPEWGMQTVRDQAVAVENYYRNQQGQDDFEVVAGVNGDFFNMGNGAPRGTLVMNSKVYNVNEGWPYFAILKDGTPVIREGGSDVSDVAQSVGGPAIIIRKGVIDVSSGYGVPLHPRTAVGIKADGSVVFVVSDGRLAPASCGQTFQMLAEEMLALGCVDAISLDGGGSATFVSQREGESVLSLRNSPADGIERTVSTSVLIYSNTKTNVPTPANKWFEENGSVGYYGADGIPVTGTQTIDGYSYNFDQNGKLTALAKVNTDGTLAAKQWVGTQYYLGADGLPVKGEQTIGGKIFTFDSETGKLIGSKLVNQWYDCGDGVCYLGSDGAPVTGQQKIGEYTYNFDEAGKLESFASVKADGTLVTNQWIGAQYYLGADGLPVKGEQTIDGYKHTFDAATGKLLKGELKKEGYYTYYYIAGQKQRNWQLIDGYWHYFDRQTGFGMATADNCDKVSIDYDRTDGKYTISTTDARLLFKFDKKGRLTGGSWLDTGNGKVYYWGNFERVTGWQVIDDDLYYFNDDAYAVTGVRTIDGAEYTFDADGKLLSTKDNSINVNGTYYYFDKSGKVVKDHVTDHAYVKAVDEAVAPEHGKAGLTKGEHCSVCGYVMIAQQQLDAIEHSYISTVVHHTCTEQGYTLYECSCGDSYKENIVAAAGHKPDQWEIVTQPQQGVAGLEQRKCVICDEVVDEREILPEGTPGDVNLDGRVNAADARLVLRMSAQIDAVPEDLLAVIDMNGDGRVTAVDARLILRKSAQLD